VPSPQPFIYENWRTFTTRDGLPHDWIRTIRVSGEQVWVGTNGGLALRESDRWRRWTQREGLPVSAVTAIDVDPQTQDVWLGTWGGGLVRFSAGRFDQFNQRNSGLAGELVFSVVVKDGRVWAATNGGVCSFDPISEVWRLYFERRADAPETVIADLCVDRQRGDCLYACEWCGRPWRLVVRRDKWTPVDMSLQASRLLSRSAPNPDEATLAIATGGEALWWLTTSRLFRRCDSGNWEAQTTHKHATGDEMVYGLTAPNDLEAWLCTDHGLKVLVDWPTGTWMTYSHDGHGAGGLVTIRREGHTLGTRPLMPSIPDNRVRCVAFQGDDVWVGTAAGLALGTSRARWNSAKVSAPGLPEDRIIEGPGIGSKQKPGERQAAPIAVLSPMTQLIGLPGAGAPNAKPRIFADRLAVQLAVKQVNERDKHRGKPPFVVVQNPAGPGYARYGWGTPEDDFPAYAYEDNVLGFVGRLTPDDKSASIAALHTGVPVVNTALTPPAIDERINPWVFRCRVNDPRQHERLLDHVFDRLGHTRVAVLRSSGELGRLHLDGWSRHARRRGHPPVADLFFSPDARNLEPQYRALRRARPDVILTWCDAQTSAATLQLLRGAGITALFVGSDLIVCEEFTQRAGQDPGAVIAIYPCKHRLDPDVAARFAETYMHWHFPTRAEGRLSPEVWSSFDAANHLIKAIDIAGPDRDAIRDALNKMGDAILARLENGEWRPFALPD